MQEIKRQENIFELIYTEKDFVNDLNYIKEVKGGVLIAKVIDY
jgi:hypothetical protein